MPNVTSVKVAFGSTTRRFQFEKNETFKSLVAKISQAFSLPAYNAINLRYYDDENDLVSLDSDQELYDAVNMNVTSTLKMVCEVDSDFELVKGDANPPSSVLAGLTSSVLSDKRRALNPTTTIVKSVADLGLSNVFSERQGKQIQIQTPVNQSLVKLKKAIKTARQKRSRQELLERRRNLKPTTTAVKSISDVLGTKRVYSERQGKMITLQEPQAMGTRQDLLREVSTGVRLKRAPTSVKSITDILGTNRVFSERQGKMITLKEARRSRPDKVTEASIYNAKRTLRSTCTRVRTVTDVLGTNRVFSERQGKMITLQEPRRGPSCHNIKATTLRHARSSLKPTCTKILSVSDVLGTNRVFSERQGKMITLQEPRRGPSCHDIKATTLCHARSSLKPTSPRVCSVTDMLQTNCVFSERQGKVITLKEPIPQQATFQAASEQLLGALCPVLSSNKALNKACEDSLTNFLQVLSHLMREAQPAQSPKSDPAQLLLAQHKGDVKAACIALMEAASF